ncbi:transcriptional regulator, LacI family [Fictibacillus enclensis]|uniref:Catabolite control protein A n=1 Tax=Fictibacillus enclensis TaxID=1017270 RepID=A0A0V8J2J1_9BACL|nr:LacI family DNA-binding transcriptional regulator [Fictibacillus enclensis]KSU81113.1 LacI family transcriptional regulator [Fictibacillus enclensis]SCC35190.1 transcriptional regulator, LacI family [Fictibacillus enclensis]
MTTIYDIAKRANVSSMTVSRVINNKGNISEATRKKVEDAIKELNYIPNSAAQSLNLKKTKLLSLVITDITNPFFSKVARGATDKANQMGYQLILCNTDEDYEKESEYIDALIAKRVDGVIIAPTGDSSLKNLKKLMRNRIPFTLIDRKIENVPCDMVLGDNYEGTRYLLQHLINNGHQRIAMVHGPLTISTSKERYQAYVETLKLNDLTVNPSFMVEDHYKQEDQLAGINHLLELPEDERPTAFFAVNNFIAIKLIKHLRQGGLRVPEDMAVVCFDDLELFIELDPFLTVSSQPAYDFGYMGTQLVIERVEGNSPTGFRSINLKPELVIRKSSGTSIKE